MLEGFTHLSTYIQAHLETLLYGFFLRKCRYQRGRRYGSEDGFAISSILHIGEYYGLGAGAKFSPSPISLLQVSQDGLNPTPITLCGEWFSAS